MGNTIVGMFWDGIAFPPIDMDMFIFIVMVNDSLSPTVGCRVNTCRGSLPASSNFTGDEEEAVAASVGGALSGTVVSDAGAGAGATGIAEGAVAAIFSSRYF